MKKFKFSSLVIILSIIHIDVFIAALLYIAYLGGTFNDTAVMCFFTFWTVEILSLAGIRVSKAKYSQTYEENTEEDEIDE